MTKSYPIEIINEEGKSLYYPKEVDFPSISTICFGNLSIEGNARPQETDKKKISITAELAKALHFPELPLRLHLFEKEGSLFIGPIVGIFTAGFTSYPQSPIGSRSLLFSKILSLYDRVGVLPIVFGIQHIEWEKGSLQGYFYYDNQWKQIEVPLPNVIYDRLPNRTVENLSIIQELKTKFAEEYAIPWFNPGFFNKMDIYNKLKKNENLEKYLPKTIPYKNQETLQLMLDEFGYLYVKPIHGSLGKGVYQIRVNEEKIFVRFRDDEGVNRLYKFPTILALANFLKSRKVNNEYIIQQGISLLKENGQNIDYRIHTNKNELGNWVVTAIACKTAGSGSATTHRFSGGTIKSIDEIFPDPEFKKENVKKLGNAVISLSEQLNMHWNGLLGEIGFDMGIDEDGNVWMFEANSKPGRTIFSHPKLRKYEKLSHRLILHYSVYLTEQVIQHPEEFFHELVLQ